MDWRTVERSCFPCVRNPFSVVKSRCAAYYVSSHGPASIGVKRSVRGPPELSQVRRQGRSICLIDSSPPLSLCALRWTQIAEHCTLLFYLAVCECESFVRCAGPHVLCHNFGGHVMREGVEQCLPEMSHMLAPSLTCQSSASILEIFTLCQILGQWTRLQFTVTGSPRRPALYEIQKSS